MTKELPEDVKAFIFYIDDPKSSFEHCFNGITPERPRIEYVKGNKHYTLEEVWHYWNENIFSKDE